MHKSVQIASDRAFSVALKIAYYFSGERNGVIQRQKDLIEFCDFIEIHHMRFPTHGKTRWLTLHPLIERIFANLGSIEVLFSFERIVPRVL